MRLNRSLVAAAALAAFFMPAVAHAQQGIQRTFSVQGPMIPLGCFQATSISAATTLATVAGGSIPTFGQAAVPAEFAVVQVEVAAARWRDDGTAPTATVGMPLAVLTPIYFTSAKLGSPSLSQVSLIPQSSSMTIDACFYGVE